MIDLNNIEGYSQEIKEYCQRTNLDLNHVSYVSTDEHAISNEPILTVGLKICSAIAISYNNQNFLIHYSYSTAEDLVNKIRANFPKEAFTSNTIKFHIWLGPQSAKAATNLEVLHQLGLLEANVDFELLKCALRKYLIDQIEFIQNLSSTRFLTTSETLFQLLSDFMQGAVFTSIKIIIEANNFQDVPLDQMVTGLRCLFTPKTMEQFNACTRQCFSIVTHNTVVGTCELNAIQPSEEKEDVARLSL
jgi:hypothetical protein